MVVKHTPAATIETYFSELRDPRIERTKRHKLVDILVIGICVVICGADDYVAMTDFGRAKEQWLPQYLELPHGIPSHDTIWRVFGAIDPEQFQACFVSWVSAVSKLLPGEIVNIDGKKLRRSHDKAGGKAAIHMVSAWARPIVWCWARSRSMTSRTRSSPSPNCCVAFAPTLFAAKLAMLALCAPFLQVRRIQTFPAQQRSNLASFCTRIYLGQDPFLYSALNLRRSAFGTTCGSFSVSMTRPFCRLFASIFDSLSFGIPH